ncbi:MAG: pyruvate, phosphate dikinase [Pseudomonadota bacterium]
MRDGIEDMALIAHGAPVLEVEIHGVRAARLSQAAALGLPVPPALVLGGAALERVAGDPTGLADAIAPLEATAGAALGDPDQPLLLAVRPGLPGAGAIVPAVLNIGLGPAIQTSLVERVGLRGAADLRRRFVQSYGAGVLGVESDSFEFALHDLLKAVGAESDADLEAEALEDLTARCLALIAERGGAIPTDPGQQLAAVLANGLRAWTAPRADLRRRARGIPDTTPLSLIVQSMALGIGMGQSGAGSATRRCARTGAVQPSGRYLALAQGEEALMGLRTPTVLSAEERRALGLIRPAIEESAPAVHAQITEIAEHLERAFGDSHALDFVVENGAVSLLELAPMRRNARAALRIAVELADAGPLSPSDAVLRVDPGHVVDHLHPSMVPGQRADIMGTGLAASPGAASGALVFSSDAAEAASARGEPAILALIETGPEDIRGMHAAAGVLTVRGGMTSHAALVARGLGRPCVVGARALRLEPQAERLSAPDGRQFGPGDIVTVDGTEGRVIAGTVETQAPEITGAFARLMDWVDERRRLEIRANADTEADAATARRFGVGGIGLCRTEHMFFQHGRIAAMREMIMAETEEARRTALARLRPMQRADFAALFREMAGLPVVVRLLDPPLHEFLPRGEADMAEIADLLGLPTARVKQRALELAEFNPMLGRRGCRIGIAFPEIYEMQTRAIFEAAAEAGAATGSPVRPEIMLPLISAVRELEVIRARIDAIAAEMVAAGRPVAYTVGVMIETPRACLRAGDIAARADFLSFGTNDLTQMLYGLSRDDAGRFMPDYVSQGVFAHDPFHRIDEEGVGEIIRIAIDRARAARPGISIGLCGEHGGDPASIDFCERAGFDYVSCSPFRLPVARLAAAQARLRHGS